MRHGEALSYRVKSVLRKKSGNRFWYQAEESSRQMWRKSQHS